MLIVDVLRRKGDTVLTAPPDLPVPELLARLAEHGIGAMVVSQDGDTIDGIVSERDVVRRLNTAGPGLLELRVSDIMTGSVRTCSPDDRVEDLMRVMTDHRIRHVPVVVDGRLTGLVSIGDVVKHRMDELESERDQLNAYITS